MVQQNYGKLMYAHRLLGSILFHDKTLWQCSLAFICFLNLSFSNVSASRCASNSVHLSDLSRASTVGHWQGGICHNHQPSATVRLDAWVQRAAKEKKQPQAQVLLRIKMDRRVTADAKSHIYLSSNSLASFPIGACSGDPLVVWARTLKHTCVQPRPSSCPAVLFQWRGENWTNAINKKILGFPNLKGRSWSRDQLMNAVNLHIFFRKLIKILYSLILIPPSTTVMESFNKKHQWIPVNLSGICGALTWAQFVQSPASFISHHWHCDSSGRLWTNTVSAGTMRIMFDSVFARLLMESGCIEQSRSPGVYLRGSPGLSS